MNYSQILNEAILAAQNAVKGKKDNMNAFNCGFAWVTIEGNDGLARYCRKQIKEAGKGKTGLEQYRAMQNAETKFGSKGRSSGWKFWNPANYNGQDMDITELGAKAFRDVLASYGIRAVVSSRLD